MERLSITNAEAQYIESRTFTKNDIASIFRVPPHMINEMSRATFSNIEHQSLEFVKYTLMPYMVMIETELNNKLTSRDKQYFKFYTNYLVRGDIKTRYEAY
jgi:HK97 family phage portal protein